METFMKMNSERMNRECVRQKSTTGFDVSVIKNITKIYKTKSLLRLIHSQSSILRRISNLK